jgi:hypothetical protein
MPLLRKDLILLFVIVLEMSTDPENTLLRVELDAILSELFES